jgi:hypothetical protein
LASVAQHFRSTQANPGDRQPLTGIKEDDGFETRVLSVVHLNVAQRFDDFVHDADADAVDFYFWMCSQQQSF